MTNYTADTYGHPLPFDNGKGADAFRLIEDAPKIKDVDDEFKESNCYKRDITLRASNISYPYTQEQIQEIKKCEDIFYFIKNYVKILTMDDGLCGFDPYQYQKNMLKLMDENRFTIFTTARQAGKCVTGDTFITIKNKKSGETERVEIEKFHERF